MLVGVVISDALLLCFTVNHLRRERGVASNAGCRPRAAFKPPLATLVEGSQSVEGSLPRRAEHGKHFGAALSRVLLQQHNRIA